MEDNSCRIKVVCRVRPMNSKEQKTSTSIVGFPTASTVELSNRMFTYDHVLQPDCHQVDVYLVAAKPLVNDVLSGYNATIFAYGQTSSGKTHTMEGVVNDSEMCGVIPRIIDDIFTHIYSMDANLEIHIKVSYFEIYMEKIRDLLDVNKVNLSVGENKNKVPYVKEITERFVTSPEEIVAVLDEGKSNRRVAVTNMNEHSSRSHAVFLISIKQENKETMQTLTGKLYLVDLAGSEKVDKTNAVGVTLDEAKTINKSLLSLSNVISALAEGNKPYIPYRDSKLTRVLQESLGGNARTTLVICCSPSSFNAAETKTTLLFGDRAKTIKNKVALNVELTAEEWRRRFEKQKEININLRAVIEKHADELSKWRAGVAVPESEQTSLANLKEMSTLSVPSTPCGGTLTPRSCTPTLLSGTPTPQVSTSDISRLTFPTADTSRTFEDKDDEIHTQGETIDRLTSQVNIMEASLHTSQEEVTSLKKQITIFEQELVNSQDEVHEVMQALEELAVSYDTKDREIQSITTEKQLLVEEMEQLQGTMDHKSHELHSLRDTTGTETRKNKDRLINLFSELREIGSVLGTKFEEGLPHFESSTDISDDDFARVRIHVSNLRCEARTLAEQRDILEMTEREAKERAQYVMKELSVCRLKISQFEITNESLSTSLREKEAKKEELEQLLYTLNEQLMELKTKEQVVIATELDRHQEQAGVVHSANEMKRTFEGEIEKRKESHLKQIEQLKKEIESKENMIVDLTQQHQDQLLAMKSLQSELASSQAKQEDERKRYGKIKVQMKVKERIKQDLGGLTDTVTRELEQLNGLRHSYIQHMTQRLTRRPLDEDTVGQSPDRLEIQFLEKNLEELSRTHKKTTTENSELQREIPRLHAVLASKSRRIGELESLLLDTKQVANQEYNQLLSENERVKQNFMAKLKEREEALFFRRQGPNIVRPVPRKSDSGSSREALLAGAGVAVVGHRKKKHLLNLSSSELTSSSCSSTSDYTSSS